MLDYASKKKLIIKITLTYSFFSSKESAKTTNYSLFIRNFPFRVSIKYPKKEAVEATYSL